MSQRPSSACSRPISPRATQTKISVPISRAIPMTLSAPNSPEPSSHQSRAIFPPVQSRTEWETDMSSELFPAFIKLEGRPCLVVGAGAIATSKIASLLRSGAQITVVAPQAKAEVAKLAAAGSIIWHQREFHTDDLRDTFLAIAATGSASVNRQVFLAAQG